ncbi:MAG: sugar ABC transporter ATP-binding protein [Oscillospiraceae bacterium]|nr:sugar ABC transporter ATP-binding protein [Oscillospiraceae bacterium]
MRKILLTMDGIQKCFSSVIALKHVSLQVEQRSIHALVGENGAGKSTLMNILSGIYPHGSYSGSIVFEGQEMRFRKVSDSESRGIVIIHQELALIPELSIQENIFLGHEICRSGVISWDSQIQETQRLLDAVGLKEDPNTACKYLGVGKQQLVEIAKALSKNVKLLIMDEPTAALNDKDSDALLNLILKLRVERGISVIIISHKLDELLKVADRITVLRDGESIETLENDGSISRNHIIRSMVGREMSNLYPERTAKLGELALEVKDWCVFSPSVAGEQIIDRVSFHLHYGEVVGIAGLMGAGRTELALSLFGKAYGVNISGEIYKDGQPLRLRTVKDAISHRIAYIPEDRKDAGLILEEDIVTNISLSNLEKFSSRGVMNHAAEVDASQAISQDIRIKAPSVFQKTQMLSGGNQQKVLVARWLCSDPDILILDEPTRGIDVGAKYEIYAIINQLAADGKAVLMISSEMPELIGMCDRIYVMNEGRFIGELLREEVSQEKIMQIIVDDNGGSRSEK